MAKYFSAQIASPSLRVDREKRCIYGVLIATRGDANGDVFDDQTLAQLVALGNAGKIRARFDHPNRVDPREVEQTLDNLLGEHVNFRIDGDAVRADAQFAGVNVEKENKVMDLAEKTPHLFGLSVVVEMAANPKSKTRNSKGVPARPIKLYAADFVDLPAANATGLFAAQAEKLAAKAAEGSMDPIDVYAKDGKCYCTVEGKEIPLNHTKEAMALIAGEGDDEPDTEAKKKGLRLQQAAPLIEPLDAAAIARKAVDEERTYRKMFGTVLSTAGITGDDAAEFEETFYGREQAELKTLAKFAMKGRATAKGESTATTETKKPTEVETVEADAGKRFDEEPTVRRTFGVNTADASSDQYKTARGRYVASARRQFEASKK